jgi:hypothetical protein
MHKNHTTLFITTLTFYQWEMLNRCTIVWISTWCATLSTAWGMTKLLSMGTSTNENICYLYLWFLWCFGMEYLYIWKAVRFQSIVGHDNVKNGKYLPTFWRGSLPPPSGQSTDSKLLWHDGNYVAIYVTSYHRRPESSHHLFCQKNTSQVIFLFLQAATKPTNVW